MHVQIRSKFLLLLTVYTKTEVRFPCSELNPKGRNTVLRIDWPNPVLASKSWSLRFRLADFWATT